MSTVLIWEDKEGSFWCEHDSFHTRGREDTLLEADNMDDAKLEAQTVTDCREDELSW